MNKNNFDIIRFIFAFIVLLRHMIELTKDHRILKFQNYFDSYSTVTGFFIISGYLIAKSYKTTTTLSNYLKKRAKRLLPAYMFFVFIATILFSFWSNYSLYEYFTNKQLYSYFFANITFLNFLQPNLPGVFLTNPHTAVNGALWTIKVEILFYLSLPVVLCCIDKSSRKIALFIVIYVFSLSYKLYLGSTGNDFMIFLSRQAPGFYCYFICGISLYYYFDFYTKNSGKLVLAAIPIYLLEYYFDLEIFRPFCFALIIFYIAYNFPKFNNFGKYGDFSYGIYIYHFPIIQIFVYYGIFGKHNQYVATLLLISIVLLISFISWNVIEKPFLKRKINPVGSLQIAVSKNNG
jgi:peptidoglycan/LPS O-acetylase OafA/YrhL